MEKRYLKPSLRYLKSIYQTEPGPGSLQFTLWDLLFLYIRRSQIGLPGGTYEASMINITCFQVSQTLQISANVSLPWTGPVTSLWIWNIFLKFIYFERSEGKRVKDIENPKQAPYCQHRAQCKSWSHEPWDHDLSQNRVRCLTNGDTKVPLYIWSI